MTKIDIISGFLGAGKTTLIKKLLDQAFRGEKVVLIENEFGEIGIDGGFLKDAGVEITEMNSGCICCSLVGDFGAALKKVLDDYAPDRIIIEPSGVGKLSDVIAAVEGVQKTTPALHLHSFVTVVDATKAKVYMKNFGEFFNNQVEHASAILLSRTQNMDQAKLDTAVRLLREKNAKAAILTTPWDQLTGAQIVSAMEGGHSLAEELMEEIAHEHHDHEHHHHHHDHEHDHDEHDHDEHDHEHEHHHDHDHDEHDHDHDHEPTRCSPPGAGRPPASTAARSCRRPCPPWPWARTMAISSGPRAWCPARTARPGCTSTWCPRSSRSGRALPTTPAACASLALT